MKCFFRLLLLASVPARAPIRGKAGAFAALLLNISPLFTLSLGSALVSVLVAGRRLQPWRGSRRDGAFQQCLGLYEGMTSNERVTVLLVAWAQSPRQPRCRTAYCGLAGTKNRKHSGPGLGQLDGAQSRQVIGETWFLLIRRCGHPIPT
jgi:hypothetical protein